MLYFFDLVFKGGRRFNLEEIRQRRQLKLREQKWNISTLSEICEIRVKCGSKNLSINKLIHRIIIWSIQEMSYMNMSYMNMNKVLIIKVLKHTNKQKTQERTPRANGPWNVKYFGAYFKNWHYIPKIIPIYWG